MTKRKFINKNRQKRKYTRKAIASPTLPVTKTLFVGILPSIILAFALVTVVLILQQFRDQAITVSIPELHFPTLSFDLAQPAAFISTLGNTITSLLQQIGTGMSNLSEQTYIGLQYFVQLVQQTGMLIVGGLVRASELFVQSMALVGTHIVQGSMTVSSAAIEYGIRGWTIIAASVVFVFNMFVIVGTFLYTVISTLIMAIIHGFIMLGEWVFSIVRIPFDAMGALWLQIKPYADILGAHIQMVGQEFSTGVDNLNKLSAAASAHK